MARLLTPWSEVFRSKQPLWLMLQVLLLVTAGYVTSQEPDCVENNIAYGALYDEVNFTVCFEAATTELEQWMGLYMGANTWGYVRYNQWQAGRKWIATVTSGGYAKITVTIRISGPEDFTDYKVRFFNLRNGVNTHRTLTVARRGTETSTIPQTSPDFVLTSSLFTDPTASTSRTPTPSTTTTTTATTAKRTTPLYTQVFSSSAVPTDASQGAGCVNKTEAYADLRDNVEFTICLDPIEFIIDNWMGSRGVGESAWSFVQMDEWRSGRYWTKSVSESGYLKITVQINVWSDTVFGISEVRFYNYFDKQRYVFPLTVLRRGGAPVPATTTTTPLPTTTTTRSRRRTRATTIRSRRTRPTAIGITEIVDYNNRRGQGQCVNQTEAFASIGGTVRFLLCVEASTDINIWMSVGYSDQRDWVRKEEWWRNKVYWTVERRDNQFSNILITVKVTEQVDFGEWTVGFYFNGDQNTRFKLQVRQEGASEPERITRPRPTTATTTTTTTTTTTFPTTVRSVCREGQYNCPGTSFCISLRWLCDGYKDCNNGEDEANCVTTTTTTTTRRRPRTRRPYYTTTTSTTTTPSTTTTRPTTTTTPLITADAVIVTSRTSPVQPYFLPTLSKIEVNEGETAVLSCAVEDLGTRIVAWSKTSSENEILAIGQLVWSQEGNYGAEYVPNTKEWRFIINDVRTTDAGLYQCQVTSKTKLVNYVELVVKGAPQEPYFLPRPAKLQFESGSTAVLICAIENIGERTVLWRRGFDQLPLSVGTYLFTGDQRVSVTSDLDSKEWRLNIADVKPVDSGMYECQISGDLQQRSNKIQIIVEDDETDTSGISAKTTTTTAASRETSTSSNFCKGNKVQCPGERKCIFETWLCDGDNDCNSGWDEDEENCRSGGTVGLDFFWHTITASTKSKAGTTLPPTPDSTTSPTEANMTGCGVGQLQCPGTEQCIFESFICDGDVDCPGSWDELNCTDTPCPWTSPFMCNNNVCIPLPWVCDGQGDCQDGEDEENCPPEKSCPPNTFKCGNTTVCIAEQWVCDGETDCPTGIDEADCDSKAMNATTAPVSSVTSPESSNNKTTNETTAPVSSLSPELINNSSLLSNETIESSASPELNATTSNNTCPEPNSFQCDDGSCIHLFWVCSDSAECPNGEDERDCYDECTSEEFECSNKKCIPTRWLCDGAADCPEGEDELESQCPTTERTCPPGQFTCSGGKCIHMDWICDGDHDCPDGSDEAICPPPVYGFNGSFPDIPTDNSNASSVFGGDSQIPSGFFADTFCKKPFTDFLEGAANDSLVGNITKSIFGEMSVKDFLLMSSDPDRLSDFVNTALSKIDISSLMQAQFGGMGGPGWPQAPRNFEKPYGDSFGGVNETEASFGGLNISDVFPGQFGGMNHSDFFQGQFGGMNYSDVFQGQFGGMNYSDVFQGQFGGMNYSDVFQGQFGGMNYSDVFQGHFGAMNISDAFPGPFGGMNVSDAFPSLFGDMNLSDMLMQTFKELDESGALADLKLMCFSDAVDTPLNTTANISNILEARFSGLNISEASATSLGSMDISPPMFDFNLTAILNVSYENTTLVDPSQVWPEDANATDLLATYPPNATVSFEFTIGNLSESELLPINSTDLVEITPTSPSESGDERPVQSLLKKLLQGFESLESQLDDGFGELDGKIKILDKKIETIREDFALLRGDKPGTKKDNTEKKTRSIRIKTFKKKPVYEIRRTKRNKVKNKPAINVGV